MPDQFRLYRRKDGKWYEPVFATQNEEHAVRWAIEYSASSPKDVVHTVWRQPFEHSLSFKKIRKPAGVRVGAEHRGRGV